MLEQRDTSKIQIVIIAIKNYTTSSMLYKTNKITTTIFTTENYYKNKQKLWLDN